MKEIKLHMAACWKETLTFVCFIQKQAISVWVNQHRGSYQNAFSQFLSSSYDEVWVLSYMPVHQLLDSFFITRYWNWEKISDFVLNSEHTIQKFWEKKSPYGPHNNKIDGKKTALLHWRLTTKLQKPFTYQ